MIKALFHPGNSRHISQLFRYGMIGVATNLASYLAYLIATSIGGTPKLTMSVLYVATAIVSYLANKKLTFRHKGGFLGSGISCTFSRLSYQSRIALHSGR